MFVLHGVPWFRSVAWCTLSWPCNPHSPKEPTIPYRCCYIRMTSPNWSLMGWLLFLEVSNPFRKRFRIYKISSKVNKKNKDIFCWYMGVNIWFIYLSSDHICSDVHKADITGFKSIKKSGQSKLWAMRYDQKSSYHSICTILTPDQSETQLLAKY